MRRPLAGDEPEPGRGERPWLFFYAPASWVCRVLLSIAIVGWVGSWSMVLGTLGLALMTAGLFVEHGAQEMVFTVSGVILLACGHILNLRHTH